MAQQKSVDELAKFDKGQLKHAETAEKNVLPGPDDIKAEQEHNKHVEGIEKFDKVRESLFILGQYCTVEFGYSLYLLQ